MGSIYKRGNTYEIIGTPVEHIILSKRCEIPHRWVRGAKLPGANQGKRQKQLYFVDKR